MTIIDTLNSELKSIINFLDDSKQPSLSSDVDRHLKKVILLSAASYFEHLIQEMLISFISKSCGKTEATYFLKNKAINRQYHTFFAWDAKNANKFLSLFGDDFKKKVENEINQDDDLQKAMKAFLEIGQLRNTMVHSNFASFDITNKTTDEIFQLYNSSKKFVTFLENKFNQENE